MRNTLGIPSPGILNLAGTSGDSWSFEIQFKNPDDSPYPLPDVEWEASASDGTRIIVFSVDVTKVAEGILVLSASPTSTRDKSGSYNWDLQVTNPGGSVRTWLSGVLTVQRDVTP